jgi:hypothetical protein
MIKYQVHFEYQVFKRNVGWVGKRGIRTVQARDEGEAIVRIRHRIPDSFGHWVNRLASEAVS